MCVWSSVEEFVELGSLHLVFDASEDLVLLVDEVGFLEDVVPGLVDGDELLAEVVLQVDVRGLEQGLWLILFAEHNIIRG